MPIEDFVILNELGKGAFGTVHKCQRKADNQIYAMKQVKIEKLKEKDRVNALNEIRLLASISDPHIIQYKESFYDEKTSNLCIVMQFANQGDLESKIKSAIKTSHRIDEKQIWKTAYDILKGLQKLHSLKIIHRDIKAANIFYNDGVAKLGDLNISKFLKNDFATTQTGTPYYASPQIWSDTPYGPKADVWSLGCVLYEMCTGKPPFRAANFEGLYKKVMAGEFEKIPLYYSTALSLFICRCLVVDHKRRCSVDDLLKFKAFQEYEPERVDWEDTQPGQAQFLSTIQLPKNLKELNQNLPSPNYQEGKKDHRKLKAVLLPAEIEPPKSPNFKLTREDSRKRLPSLANHKSQKVLPMIPSSSKLAPPPTHLEESKYILKRIDSSKNIRVKPKSTKLII